MKISIKVLINPYETKYLIKEYDANDTIIEDDDTMVEKFINNYKENGKNEPNITNKIESASGYWYSMTRNEYNKFIHLQNHP